MHFNRLVVGRTYLFRSPQPCVYEIEVALAGQARTGER